MNLLVTVIVGLFALINARPAEHDYDNAYPQYQQQVYSSNYGNKIYVNDDNPEKILLPVENIQYELVADNEVDGQRSAPQNLIPETTRKPVGTTRKPQKTVNMQQVQRFGQFIRRIWRGINRFGSMLQTAGSYVPNPFGK